MARPNKPWFRKDVRWWVTSVNGRQIRLAKGKNSKGEAERRFHEIMAVRPRNPGADDARVADVIEAYLKDGTVGLAPDTIRCLRFFAQKFAEDYGNLETRKLIPYHVTQWTNSKPGWRETTVYNARRSIFRFFSWACEQGLLSTNPLKGMKRPRPRSRQRSLTDYEYRTLLAAAHGPFRIFVWALRQTGARPSELRRLTWDEVHDDRWVIREHKTQRKTRRPRVVHLTPAMQRLMAFLRKRSTSHYVFVNTRGKAWSLNATRLQMSRLKRKHGLHADLGCYHLRHTFATQSILKGIDAATLAQLMGNSVQMVSEVYLHLANEINHLKEAAKRAVQPPLLPTPRQAEPRPAS